MDGEFKADLETLMVRKRTMDEYVLILHKDMQGKELPDAESQKIIDEALYQRDRFAADAIAFIRRWGYRLTLGPEPRGDEGTGA